MGLKKWNIKEFDRVRAKELAEECDINSFLALLALNRGITEAYEIDELFSDDIELEDPFSLADMDLASERILKAIDNFEKICVYGDYDCDGVTSTAIVFSYLKSVGADVIYYIPDRLKEGYGMNCAAIEKLKEQGIELIITVDNGINAGKEVALANEFGMDVVITDHHLPLTDLPEAVAVVNPHRIDDMSDCKYLSGVGVAFKLLCALSYNSSPIQMLERYADIITLGTVGDIVPLLRENRTICKYGLNIINNSACPGIEALKQIAGMVDRYLNVSSLSFTLVPRINAAGRMGCSDRAVELLLETNPVKALEIAEELDEENTKRQVLCEKMFNEACDFIDKNSLSMHKVITVFKDDWHSGIIGIVASKLVEKYCCPTIVFAKDGELLHGSGRSIEGFNLFNAISYSSEYTEYFGGHELAAGLTIKETNFNSFSESINDYAEDIKKAYPSITIDCKLRPEVINPEFVRMIKLLEPFGAGNPEPLFGIFNGIITHVEPIKQGKFIKIIIKKNETILTGLSFYHSFDNFPYSIGDKVDIAATLEINQYKGKENVTLFIKAIRPNGIDEDKYFETLDAFEALLNDKITSDEAKLILPNRDDFKLVFSLLKQANKSLSEEYIINKLHNIGAGKIIVVLLSFIKLGVLFEETVDNEKRYSLNLNSPKVNLEESEIIKKLTISAKEVQ